MKTMKRIKRRMAWLNIERAENLIVRKAFDLFMKKLEKDEFYMCKSGTSMRFDFSNAGEDPGQGKLSIPNGTDK